MNKASALTLALIEKRPMTAAKSLESMAPSDAAAFVQVLPIAQSVSVISSMSAWRASTILSALHPKKGATILAQMEYQGAASLLRLVPEDERRSQLDALPRKLRRKLSSTLAYAADTVGANMSVMIVSIDAKQTVADALAELRLLQRARTGVAFVVDDDRHLRGVVSASELLQSPGGARLRDVMDRSVPLLSARARLASVSGLPAWDDYPQLPVVNREKQVIGALSRKIALRKTVEATPQTAAAEQSSILASIAYAFASSVLGLGELLADADEAPRRQETSAPSLKTRARP